MFGWPRACHRGRKSPGDYFSIDGRDACPADYLKEMKNKRLRGEKRRYRLERNHFRYLSAFRKRGSTVPRTAADFPDADDARQGESAR